jgi:hypothetical protein
MPETTEPRVDPDEKGLKLLQVLYADLVEEGMIGAQAAISADIDAILKRLDDGIPRLFEDMKNIQASLRRPLAF